MTRVAEAFNGTQADYPTLGFLVGGDRQEYLTLFSAYANSEYGRHHREQPLRYEAAFGCYERPGMLRDLGRDVHPLGHMPATEQAFVDLMKQRYSPSFMDVHTGRVVAMVHDMGECTHPQIIQQVGAVVGDIPQGEKTEQQRATEMDVWDFLADRLLRGRLPDAQLDRVRRLVFHQEGSDRFDLHAALEAAHDTNTLRVGLRAGRIGLGLLERNDTDSVRFACLSVLGKVVTKDIVPKIEEHARSFVLPDRLLTRSEPLLGRIQAEL